MRGEGKGGEERGMSEGEGRGDGCVDLPQCIYMYMYMYIHVGFPVIIHMSQIAIVQ